MAQAINPLQSTARLAGLLYLTWILTAVYGLLFVHTHTIVNDDSIATYWQISANEFIYRTGIVNSLFSSVVWILLAHTLYRLFRKVNKDLAIILLVMVIVQIPVVFIAEAFSLTSLAIIKGTLLSSWELARQQEFAILLLKINNNLTITLEMFWGLWLLPFGRLVYVSGFIPRILGILLIACGIAYMIHCIFHIMLPRYQELVFRLATPIWIMGEITIMLWLLIKGVRSEPRT